MWIVEVELFGEVTHVEFATMREAVVYATNRPAVVLLRQEVAAP